MLSQSAEYALRAVVALAQSPNAPLTTHELSRRTQVPAGYLSKLLQTLGRARLVTAQRGFRGGFRLSRPPHEISAWDVVDAVAPLRRSSECPLRLHEHREQLCALHRRLDAAFAQVDKALRRTTLDQLLRAPAACRPLGASPPPVNAADTATPDRGRRRAGENVRRRPRTPRTRRR